MVRHLKRKSEATKGGAGSTSSSVAATVKDVIDTIRSRGDAAVREYSQKFDTSSPSSFKLSQSQIDAAIAACSKQIIDDIKAVQINVRNFAQAQRESIRDFEVETQPGVFLGQKMFPSALLAREAYSTSTRGMVLILNCRYIPGGRYPLLASAHMAILTAKVAGVQHVIGCTPPIAGRIPNGTVTTMALAGADEIFILGGVQAIAAMAVGTETIRKVDFTAGPGNAFVAEGKR